MTIITVTRKGLSHQRSLLTVLQHEGYVYMYSIDACGYKTNHILLLASQGHLTFQILTVCYCHLHPLFYGLQVNSALAMLSGYCQVRTKTGKATTVAHNVIKANAQDVTKTCTLMQITINICARFSQDYT